MGEREMRDTLCGAWVRLHLLYTGGPITLAIQSVRIKGGFSCQSCPELNGSSGDKPNVDACWFLVLRVRIICGVQANN